MTEISLIVTLNIQFNHSPVYIEKDSSIKSARIHVTSKWQTIELEFIS